MPPDNKGNLELPDPQVMLVNPVDLGSLEKTVIMGLMVNRAVVVNALIVLRFVPLPVIKHRQADQVNLSLPINIFLQNIFGVNLF